MSALLDPENDSPELLVELTEREGRIARAQRNAYYEIGLELKAIRDKQLYKVPRATQVVGRYSFDTFEDYCDQRWEMSRPRAYQLIEASELASKMSTNVDVLPARESHIRPLVERLSTDEDRLTVWRSVVDDGPDRITANIVTEHIERYLAARDKEYLTLGEWQGLDDAARQTALTFTGGTKFNSQDGTEERSTQNIEWAQWSWNPVTGCKHACPYCYARDIAQRFYPMKFEPAFWYKRLSAPKNTPLPKQAATDISFRNVFTCSMADLFGRWVPDVWVRSVLAQVEANPQWNFLFLTKFPKRLREFTFPDNAWIGTSVDCQARVKAAEEAFAHVDAKVKWLSIEPMIEPLTFKYLDVFQWMVIGGASRSTQTPEWRVPVEWWAPLYLHAKELGLTVYLKSNLYERERGYPGAGWKAPTHAPEAFAYLKAKAQDDIELGER